MFSRVYKLLDRSKKTTGVTDTRSNIIAPAEDIQELMRGDLLSADLEKAAEEERMTRKKEVSDFIETIPDEIDLKEGDYTVQVHIVEIQDLKGKNWSGLSDAVVYVDVLDQQQHTRVYKEVSSCFIDEHFFFNFSKMKKEQLINATIRITVFDANTFFPNELIGTYQVDFFTVYSSSNHELYRRWCSLVDTTHKKKKKQIVSGAQGLLKFSAVCLGPGDVQKIHDETKEVDEEAMADLGVQHGMGAEVALTSDGVSQSLVFLVIGVIRAEGLPGFSRLLGKTGMYCCLQAEFGGSSAIRTSSVSVKGKHDLSPDFEEELWIPVWVPSMSKKVVLTVINKEFGRRHQVVATALIDFDSIMRLDKDPVSGRLLGGLLRSRRYTGPPLIWVNFYGANPDVKGNDYTKIMNKFPDLGAGYRGRALLSLRILRKPGSISEMVTKKVINYEIPETLLPKMKTYCLRVMAYRGADLCNGRSYRYGISVTLGSSEKRYLFKNSSSSFLEWNELNMMMVELPADLGQLPDIFINVYRGSDSNRTPVAFTRLKPVPLLSVGMSSAPHWYELKHDTSRGPLYGYPGAALLRIGMVNKDDLNEKEDWEPERKKLAQKRPYCLRVYVYQAKRLPAAMENSLIDPYVKVRFSGHKKKTQVKRGTRNPVYYECLEFQEELPEDLRLAPNIGVEVWDNNFLPGPNRNIPMAALRQAASGASVVMTSAMPPPVPTWLKLSAVDGTGSMGEILISFQFILKKDVAQHIERPRHFEPHFRRAWLDIHVIGVRAVTKKGLVNTRINNPYLRFDITTEDGNQDVCTSTSRKPSGSNANFLERHIMDLMIPEDPLYTPELEVRCFDRRVGGVGSLLIGATSIPLDNKLPWNPSLYIAPRQHLILMNNIKARQALQKKIENVPDPEDDDDEEDARRNRKRSVLDDEEDDKDEDDEDEPDFFNEGLDEDETDEDEDDGRGGHGVGSGQSLILPQDMLHDDHGNVTGGVKPKTQKEVHPDDTGQGVFPTPLGAKIVTSKPSVNLPTVQDQEEIQRLKLERAKQLRKEREQASNPLNLQYSPDGSLLATPDNIKDIKAIINFPTTWADTKFLEGREWWMNSPNSENGGELENLLKTSPFESYALYHGHLRTSRLVARRHTLKEIGTLKAVIRVCTQNPRYDEEYNTFYRTVKNTDPCVVRAYIIKGQNLQPKDRNGKADPYLRVSLGDTMFNDRANKIKETVDPEFFRTFEFPPTELPGAAKLKIQVWDHDFFTPDDFIGETIIDLEDRWFHPDWTKLGDIKPVEVRQLSTTKTRTTQGQIMLWLDIMTVQQAQKVKPIPICAPEKKKFEVRIIVWRCMNVPRSISDLYVKTWLETDPDNRQDTDTHWRAKKGVASWNWRIKFPIFLPIRAREMGRVRIQLFDRDILKNAIIGENHISLYDWLLLAYHRNQPVYPFKEIHDAIKRQQGNFGFEEGTTDELDEDLLGIEMIDDDDTTPLLGGGSITGVGGAGLSKRKTGGKDRADSEGAELVPMKSAEDGKSVTGKEISKEKDSKSTGGKDTKSVSGKDEKKDDTTSPLHEDKEKDNKKKSKKKTDAETPDDKKEEETEEEDDVDALSKQIKEYLGIGDVIADDAEWIPMTYHDRSAQKTLSRGKLAVSISIVPESEMVNRPVGTGRDEPNTNPYLPPPFGRMTWTLNPLNFLGQVFGPGTVRLICLCLCCCGYMLAFLFLGNYLAGFYSTIEMANWFIP